MFPRTQSAALSPHVHRLDGDVPTATNKGRPPLQIFMSSANGAGGICTRVGAPNGLQEY